MDYQTESIIRMAAFADTADGGNPAGVVLEADGMSAVEKLEIAAEVGYSETAFLSRDGGRRRLEYFSPQTEIAFCGHATIATAVALAGIEGTGSLSFDTRAGVIEVDTARSDDGRITATLTSPPSSSRPASAALLDGFLHLVDLSRSDLDPDLDSHVACAGNDHLVVSVADRTVLASLAYDFGQLKGLMEHHGLTTVHVSWRETEDQFHARDFFPVGGIYEDPATGAAAAAFGGYLRSIDGPADRTFSITQGEDMGRTSHLHVATSATSARVRVSGTATPISKGPGPGRQQVALSGAVHR